MKAINGTSFFTAWEIGVCFDFSTQKLLDQCQKYYFVRGIAHIGLFLDEWDREIQQNSIVPADVSCHMLNGFIRLHHFSGVFDPYAEYIEYSEGFYVTEYLEVDGMLNPAETLASNAFPFKKIPDNVGFAFRERAELESIMDRYEDEFVDEEPSPLVPIDYYKAEDINDRLKEFGLFTNDISELIIQQKSLIDTESEPVQSSNHEPLSSIKETNLLRTIGALSLLLMQNNSNRYGKGNKPKSSVVSAGIIELLENLEVSTYGQSKSTLTDLIKKGVQVALEE